MGSVAGITPTTGVINPSPIFSFQDSACVILQVAASMPYCKALRDACEDCCARHFDYCIIPPADDFQGLDASCISHILQV